PTNCCATLLVDGSIRVIGNLKSVTQTEPSPAAISPPGPTRPALIVATTLLVFGSMREIVPSPWLSVHTPPSPTVRNRGPLPTGIVSTARLVAGSMRVTRFFSVLVTHSAPSPNATP